MREGKGGHIRDKYSCSLGECCVRVHTYIKAKCLQSFFLQALCNGGIYLKAEYLKSSFLSFVLTAHIA